MVAVTTFAADVSSYQRPVDNTYPYRWIIIRAGDGTYVDPNFAHNYQWACAAADAGRIEGFTVYSVFEPGVDSVALLRQQVGSPHERMTWMLDVERWGGRISGDHSPQCQRLVGNAVAWLGQGRVLVYANRSDFAELFPKRPSWLSLVVASYGSIDPAMPHEVGWQYSDGETKFPVPAGYPRSCPPFGACDHNVFPGLTPEQLAVRLGVGSKEFAMDAEAAKRFDALEAQVAAIAAKLVSGVSVNGLLDYSHVAHDSVEAFFTGVPGYVPLSKRVHPKPGPGAA